MKKKILEALKAKFPGVNANVLDRIADKLAKTVTTDEQVETAVAGVTQDIIDVIESYGDSRATESAQTAVRNYETTHKLKDGKPAPDTQQQQSQQQQQQQGGTGNETPEWAKALIDANKALTERLNKIEGDRTANERKQQLTDIVAKLPENLRKPYERISLDGLDDAAFSKLKDEIGTEVDGIVADMKVKGAVLGRPAAQHGGNNGKEGELTEAQLTAIKGGEAGKDGQPF